MQDFFFNLKKKLKLGCRPSVMLESKKLILNLKKNFELKILFLKNLNY